ncbi:MAG: MBL fold metallo-hydrolase [Pseudomonadota bacterium]
MALSRRSLLASAAAAPLLPLATQAAAGGHSAKAPAPLARSFAVGDMTVTTLLAGSGMRDEPQGTFGMNVSAEEFARVSEENFISSETYQGFFTPVLVETGSETILFDTGLPGDGVPMALESVGLTPADITHVVITHMHPDHIGGLTGDGGATYANASYVTGAREYNFWTSGPGSQSGLAGQINEKVVPFAERMRFLDEGGEVRPGITAMGAFGHTPGHMAYMLSSGGAQLLITADMANHHVWSLANPDWEVRFDADKAAAAATRRRILGMLAADRIPMVGYHMPFPAAGYVETRGDGFHWVPVTYQMAAT